jgi:hypothetical protein
MKKTIITMAVALAVAISANAKVHESKATCLRELGSVVIDKTVEGHRIVGGAKRDGNAVLYVFDRTNRYAIVEVFGGKFSPQAVTNIAHRYASDWRVIDRKEGLYYSDSTKLYLDFGPIGFGVFDSEGKRFMLSRTVRRWIEEHS